MRLSESETIVLCRRIFFALGFPLGADIAASNALVWLALMGFPALEHLKSNIPTLRCNSHFGIHISKGSDETLTIDASEDSGFFAPIEIVDLLCARANIHKGRQSTAQVLGLEIPLMLLPLAFDKSREGFEFVLEFSSIRIFAEKGQIWSNRELNHLTYWKAGEKVDIVCVRGKPGTIDPDTTGERIVEQSLDELRRKHSEFGIEIADEMVRALKAVAAESFVPASEHSRRRGAGAEVDDSG